MICRRFRFCEWCREKGLIPLEDAAPAHGASMQGRKMGTWGVMAIFSFHASKMMPTVEGGWACIGCGRTTNSRPPLVTTRIRGSFLPTALSARMKGTGFGQKYRMHPFAAAVARQQLRGLEERNALVARNVRR